MFAAVRRTYLPDCIPQSMKDVCNTVISTTCVAVREIAALIFQGPYLNFRAKNQTFQNYHKNINPAKLSDDQVGKTAIFILHGSGGNHGSCLPLALHLANKGHCVFTESVDYDSKNYLKKVDDKIRTIQKIYNQCINLVLVGHSRGGTTFCEYQLDYKDKADNVVIKKVISIDGRVRIVNEIWLKRFWQDIENLIQDIGNKLSNKKPPWLTCIRASHSWLMRHGVNYIEECKQITIRGTSHYDVIFDEKTHKAVETEIASISSV